MSAQGTEEVAPKGSVVNDRTCIVSRQAMAPARLIRFVLGPDGSVVPDLRRRLPGRGAHVVLSRAAVDEAMRRKLFARAFRAKTSGPEDLGSLVDALLVKAALGSLGLARKAGQVLTGATKVDGAIRSGRALALVHASDAAGDGIRKMQNACYAVETSGGMPPSLVYRLLDSEELGLALGGENVIHAAILAGAAGSAAALRLEAIATYRGQGSDFTGGASSDPTSRQP